MKRRVSIGIVLSVFIILGFFNQNLVLASLNCTSTEKVNIYASSKLDNDLILSITHVADEVLMKFDRFNTNDTKFNIVVAKGVILNRLRMWNSTGASFNGDVIGIDLQRIDEPRIINTIRHEMIHAITWFDGNKTPGWFDEGVAQYYMFDINRKTVDYGIVEALRTAYKKEGIFSFKDLDSSSGKWKRNRELAYDQSTCMYYYLINKYDEDSINELFYTVDDFYKRLETIAGISFNEIEKEWIDSIILGKI